MNVIKFSSYKRRRNHIINHFHNNKKGPFYSSYRKPVKCLDNLLLVSKMVFNSPRYCTYTHISWEGNPQGEENCFFLSHPRQQEFPCPFEKESVFINKCLGFKWKFIGKEWKVDKGLWISIVYVFSGCIIITLLCLNGRGDKRSDFHKFPFIAAWAECTENKLLGLLLRLLPTGYFLLTNLC